MRFIYFVLYFVICIPQAYAASLAYSQKQCQEIANDNPPQINIFYNYGKITYNYDATSEHMSALLLKTNPKHQLRNIHGLTEFNPYISIESLLQSSIMPSKRHCIYPNEINIKVGYRPEVFILNSLQKNSCRYNLTLRHEQTHLAIGHEVLHSFAYKLKNEMPKLVKDIGVKVTSKDLAKERIVLAKAYEKQVNKLFQDFVADLLKQQSILDTEKNYTQESKLCH